MKALNILFKNWTSSHLDCMLWELFTLLQEMMYYDFFRKNRGSLFIFVS